MLSVKATNVTKKTATGLQNTASGITVAAGAASMGFASRLKFSSVATAE